MQKRVKKRVRKLRVEEKVHKRGDRNAQKGRVKREEKRRRRKDKIQ